jgi:nucleoside phosphorylase
MPESICADVLLVSCNENELAAVRQAFSSPSEPSIATGHQVTALDYGTVGANRVLHIHTRQGEDSAVRVQRAVSAFDPAAILAVGICWGARDEDPDPAKRQRIGDVLIARQIKDTGSKRVKDGQTSYPGQQADSSGSLVEALQTVLPEWQTKDPERHRVDSGLLVSEPTLFNDKPARDAVANKLGALGGEMEGAGILRWAHELKVDWLLIKAICDWGYKKDNANKQADQEFAAKQAATLVRHFVGRVNIGGMFGGRNSGAQPINENANGGGNQIIHGDVQTAINAPHGTLHINLRGGR